MFAVKRPGQDKAVAAKGLFTEALAKEYIANSKAKDKDAFYIEKRPGERTKCLNFCHVNPWCNIHQEYLKTVEKT